MTIDTEVVNKSTAILKLSGRLDTANAPLLEQKIKQWGDEITVLVLDFEYLDYISSMGLRVLLHAKKASGEKKRDFVVRNMGAAVREVFEITGFIDLIVREEGFVVVRNDEGETIVLSLNGVLSAENVPQVFDELAKIKDQGRLADDPVKVVLDMTRLYCILPNALRQLRQTLADTAWEKRELRVRNLPCDYQKEMESMAFGEFVSGWPGPM